LERAPARLAALGFAGRPGGRFVNGFQGDLRRRAGLHHSGGGAALRRSTRMGPRAICDALMKAVFRVVIIPGIVAAAAAGVILRRTADDRSRRPLS